MLQIGCIAFRSSRLKIEDQISLQWNGIATVPKMKKKIKKNEMLP